MFLRSIHMHAKQSYGYKGMFWVKVASVVSYIKDVYIKDGICLS